MFGVEETSNLYSATQAKSVSEGLDQQLEGFIREHPDVRLIIIDTLQKIREIGGDRYSYASDYEIVTKLKAFSDKYWTYERAGADNKAKSAKKPGE